MLYDDVALATTPCLNASANLANDPTLCSASTTTEPRPVWAIEGPRLRSVPEELVRLSRGRLTSEDLTGSVGVVGEGLGFW